MPTVNLLPDAEGSVQQWNPFPAGVSPIRVSHWDKVDDPVDNPDEDATYVYTEISNDIEDFNHTTSDLLIGAIITNVRITARAKYLAIGFPASGYMNLGLKIAGTRYPADVSAIVTISYTDYSWNWANNPADSEAWEKSDIDGLQTSLQSISLYNAQLRCTQVYITVTFTIPPVPPVAGKGLVSWTP